MAFDVVDVTSWPVLGQEAGGAEVKDWIAPLEHATGESREHWWLYKTVKYGRRDLAGGDPGTYRRHDDEVERIACALARLMTLPVADIELARSSEGEGIISRNVTPDGWSIQGGDVILSELPGYLSCVGENRPKNRVGHNLRNIHQVLERHGGPPGEYEDWSAFDVFAGYLVFDAWVANTDRHAMNWAVLDRRGRSALAPSYDHGSALASGLADEDLERRDPIGFAQRGMAARFEDGRRVSLVDWAKRAVAIAGAPAAEWIQRLDAVPVAEVEAAVSGILGLSEVRRTFLLQVLSENRRRLVA